MKKILLFAIVFASISIATATMREVAPFYFPIPTRVLPANGTQSAIDADNEKAGVCFTSPSDMQISSAVWHTQTVTTGGSLEFRIETMSGLGTAQPGTPSGNLYCANSSGTITLSAADDNVARGTTLVSPCTLTKYSNVCMYLSRLPGSTFSGNFYVRGAGWNVDTELFSLAVSSLSSGANWTKVSAPPYATLIKSDGTFPRIPSTVQTSSITINNYSTSSSYSERGNIFILPYSAKVSAVQAVVDADQQFNLNIYDGANEIYTVNYTTFSRSGVAGLPITFPIPEITFIANRMYRVTIEAAIASNISMVSIGTQQELQSAGQGRILPGWPNSYSTVAKNPTMESSWINDPGTWYPVSLYITQIDDGGGGYGVSQ
jgi:hypothetical protein